MLEELLAFAELVLLLLKLFTHDNLAVFVCQLLVLAVHERPQNSVLVESSPFINLVFKPRDNAHCVISEVLAHSFSHVSCRPSQALREAVTSYLRGRAEKDRAA
jgi:hypothetical protein